MHAKIAIVFLSGAKDLVFMSRHHSYYVYMLTGNSRRALYIGVTNNLERRLAEHRNGMSNSFTAGYALDQLIYFEHFVHIDRAISREKELKGWKRSRKNELIRSVNPGWRDLSEEWGKPAGPVLLHGKPVSFDEEETRDPSLRSG